MESFGFSDRVAVADVDRERYLGFAESVARAAGAETLPYFRSNLSVENKKAHVVGAYDPVTEADRACERVIRESIRAAFPDHGIYGESTGTNRVTA